MVRHFCRTIKLLLMKTLNFLLSICLALYSAVAISQCSSTSAISAGTIIDDGTYGDLGYSNPTNAQGSDNNRAIANVLAFLLSGNTHYLRATGFNFAIPSTASICGVKVEVEKRAGGLGIGAWIRDDKIRLIKGGTITGDNLANTGANWSGTDSYHTYGNTTEMWGTTLTPADVNAGNFGVAFSAEFTGLLLVLPSAEIDDIRMTVYFNLLLPTRIISFDASLKNNSAYLEWQTGGEANNESVILQRLSPGGSEWTDIARFEMQQGITENKYSYTDPLDQKGNYSYRLAITSATKTTYSNIQQIRFEGRTAISLYPNPSHDFIIIEGTGVKDRVTVTNVFGQSIQLQTKLMSGNKLQATIQQLPVGTYFITINEIRARFIKR